MSVACSLLKPASVAALLARRYRIEASGVRVISTRFHDTYRVLGIDGASYVAKLYRLGQASQQLDCEAAALRCAAAGGLLVAPLIEMSDGSHSLSIACPEGERWLAVQPWLSPAPAPREARGPAAAGRVLSVLHSHLRGVPVSERTPMAFDAGGLAEIVEFVVDGDPEGAAGLRRLLGVDLAGLVEAPSDSVIHGDYHVENLLESGARGLAVLDFDRCGRGPALYDVGTYAWAVLRQAHMVGAATGLRAALLQIREFADSYARAGGEAFCDRRIYAMAAARQLMAIKLIRDQAPAWGHAASSPQALVRQLAWCAPLAALLEGADS